MGRFIIGLVLLSFGLSLPAAGQTSGTPSKAEAKENSITLSDDQKQAVIHAAITAKSRQKTPKEFSPSLGATVPREVYLHAFKPSETQKSPLLKEYWYAFLDREVVLVDAAKKKVVAVVDLPETLVADEQPHQGAAEASSEGTKDNASSVPSHTSPETIK